MVRAMRVAFVRAIDSTLNADLMPMVHPIRRWGGYSWLLFAIVRPGYRRYHHERFTHVKKEYYFLTQVSTIRARMVYIINTVYYVSTVG